MIATRSSKIRHRCGNLKIVKDIFQREHFSIWHIYFDVVFHSWIVSRLLWFVFAFFSPFLFVCPRYIQSVKKMDDMQFNTVDTIARICASIIHSFRPTSFIQLKKTVRLARRVLDNLWNACFSLNIVWFFFYSTQSFWVSDQSFLRWICLFVVNIWNDADEWGSFWNMAVGRGHHREFYLISTPWIEVLILYMNRSEFFLPRELKCCCFVVLLDKKKSSENKFHWNFTLRWAMRKKTLNFIYMTGAWYAIMSFQMFNDSNKRKTSCRKCAYTYI